MFFFGTPVLNESWEMVRYKTFCRMNAASERIGAETAEQLNERQEAKLEKLIKDGKHIHRVF